MAALLVLLATTVLLAPNTSCFPLVPQALTALKDLKK